MTITPTLKMSSRLVFVVAISLLWGCGSDTTTTNNTIESATDTAAVPAAETKTENGFYDIPSPIQQVQLLQKAGAGYDKTLLNPLDNVSKYSLTNSKALNLGIYGADLSYASVFNQPQDAILYLTACKKISDALGIKGDFYADVMKRISQNSGNKDSLLFIVSDVYRKSNESLKENDQSHISALVVAGSFIEGMYIGTQVARTVNNKTAIYERISQFRGTLNSLVGLIATVSDSNLSDVLADLKSIKAIYDETPDATLTEEQMSRITKQVKAIRIRITNM